MRELERTQYNKDFIVSAAYKLMRMLKSLDAVTKSGCASPNTLAPMTANLITDVKLIIGLTTINNEKEHECLIHARRTTSAEQDMFNAGADVSRRYIENEEDYEEVAKETIRKCDGTPPKRADANEEEEEEEEDEYDALTDALPSRIPTCMPYNRHNHNISSAAGHRKNKPSLVRILCARIAISKLQNQERTPEQIYNEMRLESIHYGGYYNEDPSYTHARQMSYPSDDDTFSTPSQDDEYTQRRMGMMREMSSPSSS